MDRKVGHVDSEGWAAMFKSVTFDRVAAMSRQPGRIGNRDDLELVRLATLAASSHNTQPWRFSLGEQAISIQPDRTRQCPVVDPADAHLYRSLGCAAENLVQAASLQGYAATVDYDAVADAVVVSIDAVPGVPATELSRALVTRQCNRGMYDGTPVIPEHIALLMGAGTGREVRCLILTDTAEISAVSELVERGNVAQLTDAAFREELLNWLRFNPAAALRKRDGLAGRVNRQPPLPTVIGKIMAPRLINAAAQAKADSARLASSAGVAIFLASTDTKEAWVEAGRAYERFALQAELLDIRSAFLNQPIEVPALRDELRSLLHTTEEPQLLVRFGHGARAPYSLRRPPREVIVD